MIEIQDSERPRGASEEWVRLLDKRMLWLPNFFSVIRARWTVRNGNLYYLRLGDFPDEPMYSIVSEGKLLFYLEDLPPKWVVIGAYSVFGLIRMLFAVLPAKLLGDSDPHGYWELSARGELTPVEEDQD